MAYRLTAGNFLEKDSVLHRLDPRAKTAACLVSLVGLSLGDRWGGCGWSLAIFGFLASGMSAGYFLKGLRAVFMLAAVGVLINGLFLPGERVAEYLPLTREGLVHGMSVASKLGAAAALARVLAATTPNGSIALSLGWIFSPLERVGLPVEEFFLAVMAAMDFLPYLYDEYSLLRRKTQFSGRFAFKRVISLAGELAGKALRAADSMELPGRGEHRTSFGPFGAPDYALIVLPLLVLGLWQILGRA